ncbi:hypothetical protein C5Y96_16290 [Blastopirellula marina]|uniref:Class I SAM-dependent methyltransferase n=1 Tax=Blastopirellula marina TaxID=124 RepID=A0A2S8F705_9BACT|nr:MULTISPECIES: hypothetical protein [Pirellulaceae]PQO27941.1 hypothetical protein C5Y96_16290 [Blastopirellula marina]RCS48366.1 hypothetical protein DTL36_16310 [Bremerella cremea]
MPGLGNNVQRFSKRVVNRLKRLTYINTVPVDVSQYSLSETELDLLEKLVEEAAQYEGPIVEIGTLLGRTTQRLATWITPPQKIVTVDNYSWNGWGISPEQHFALASEILYFPKHLGLVEQVRMDKDEFYRTYSGPAPSMVFLDAMHTYEETRKDIAWARSLGVPIICGHDHNANAWPGVVQAANEFGGAERLQGSVFVLPKASMEPVAQTANT